MKKLMSLLILSTTLVSLARIVSAGETYTMDVPVPCHPYCLSSFDVYPAIDPVTHRGYYFKPPISVNYSSRSEILLINHVLPLNKSELLS